MCTRSRSAARCQWQGLPLFQQLALVWRKVAHALHFASRLALLESDQLTDEVELEKKA